MEQASILYRCLLGAIGVFALWRASVMMKRSRNTEDPIWSRLEGREFAEMSPEDRKIVLKHFDIEKRAERALLGHQILAALAFAFLTFSIPASCLVSE